MNIGIDARFYGTTGKGLGRYTQKLIENLEKIDHKNQYFIFLRKENFDEYEPAGENFKKILADYKWYTFSEQIFFPMLLKRHKLDLVHFPHFNVPILYRKPIVVTIHDLILLHFPTIKGTTLAPFWYRIKFLAYRFTIGSAIERSKKVIAVSEFTKRDILDHYPIPKDKIIVTYEACDDFCRIAPNNGKGVLEKYGLYVGNHGIIRPYVLYVGNAYPHKNLENLIMSFTDVLRVKKDVRLVLVGKMDYFYDKIKRFCKDEGVKNVIFAGSVSDEELDCLYKNASVYVFPSLYEGFGLPPLEAMAKGTAVACSDHECMKEILGDSALYFNGRNPKSISRSVLEILNDEKKRKNLEEKGHKKSSSYSWKKMAELTISAYEEIK